MAGSALAFDVTSDVSNFSRAMALVESTAKQKAASFALEFTGAGRRVETVLGDTAKRSAVQIGSSLSTAAKKYEAEFTAAAKTVGSSLTQALAQSTAPAALNIGRSLVPVLASLAGIAAGYVAITSATSQANEQLERFIKLGENAERAGVGVEFFQRFTEAAKEAKIEVAAIEAALRKAGETVTPKFEQADPIRSRLTDLFESGYLGNYQSQALGRYRSAGNNEDRIRAAVDAMRELRDLGQGLAAIDLAERLFGTDVAERIRSGRLEIEAIIESLNRQRTDLVKQEEVERAVEFKERLAEAYQTIDEALHVSIALAESGKAINDIWLAIAETVAKAAKVAGGFLDQMLNAARAAKEAQGAAGLQSPLAAKEPQEGDTLGATLGAVAGRSARGRTIYDAPAGPDLPKGIIENAPLPPRRLLDMVLNPEKFGIGVKPSGSKKEASDSFDAVETYINSIERTTAALKAETAALGMAGGERLAAVNAAKLEATARQQGITLTQEQIDKVRALSLATDEYKSAIEENMEAQNFIRTAGGDVFRGLAADARNGATAIDLITNAVDRLAARLSDRAMDTFANALFGKSGSGEAGLLGGLFSGGGGKSSGVGLGDILGFFTGSVSPLPKFADGAIFRGPGTGTSDSMLARVSTGEAIIPARVVAQNRPVVEALVRDRLPRFADGYMPDLGALTAGSMAQVESRLNAAPSPRLPADRQTGMSADITIKGGEKTGVESSMGPQGPRMEITLDKMVASMLLGGPDTRAAIKKLTGNKMIGG